MPLRDYSTAELVDYYTELLNSSDMDLHNVEPDMEEKGVSEKFADITMRILLSQDLIREKKGEDKRKTNTIIYVFLFSLFISTVLFFLTGSVWLFIAAPTPSLIMMARNRR